MRQGGQGSTAPTAPDGKDPGRNEFIQLSRVPYVDFTFGRLPMAPFLGRYAGGSDIQLVKDAQSGMLASLEVSNVRLPQGARDRIQACLGKGYEASSHMARLFNLRANGGAGVTDPTRPLLWSHNLLVTRPPRGEPGPAGGDKRICNAILTGWIYPRGLTPSGAAGNHLQGSVPLAGVLDPLAEPERPGSAPLRQPGAVPGRTSAVVCRRAAACASITSSSRRGPCMAPGPRQRTFDGPTDISSSGCAWECAEVGTHSQRARRARPSFDVSYGRNASVRYT